MKKNSLLLFISFSLILSFTVCSEYPTGPDKPTVTPTSDPSSNSNVATTTGIFRLILKDKPVDEAKSIYVTIDRIRVHKAPGNFIVVLEEVREFDLLELKNNPQEIVDTDLEEGHYNQIRMSVVSGRIIVDEEGAEAEYELNIPSSEIKIPVQFKIEESGTVKIILDFEADKSIGVTKNKKKSIYKLRPVIKVENISYS